MDTIFHHFASRNDEKWCPFKTIIGSVSRQWRPLAFLHNPRNYFLAAQAAKDGFQAFYTTPAP
jgi:hypothetical protein